MKSIESAKVEDFIKHFGGEAILPDDASYDEVRKIWNGMIDRKPGMIARCKSAEDVVLSVNFARENNLLVSVRGGGHNIAGNAVCDDGLMIDLTLLNEVQVYPSAQKAIVGPGCTLGDIDAKTQNYGLATPVGINSTTGIAGLTLGGGFGWLSRKYGMTIDSLVSANVVTADGRQLLASETENQDLFWALRGGAVVTLASLLSLSSSFTLLVLMYLAACSYSHLVKPSPSLVNSPNSQKPLQKNSVFGWLAVKRHLYLFCRKRFMVKRSSFLPFVMREILPRVKS
ncbi:FAD-binding oxidoreductase [Vibrio natriegens]|uniref:FAD-binding oxidoreductase n=1 Tax=Vibrio natriegens TaxID=691 RepID=UPI000AF41028|nr:FAD-dependent oxidoreductase [Vibrio natriegens]